MGSTWGAVDFAQTLVAQAFRVVGRGLRGRVSAADRLRAVRCQHAVTPGEGAVRHSGRSVQVSVPLRRELAGGAHSPASRAAASAARARA